MYKIRFISYCMMHCCFALFFHAHDHNITGLLPASWIQAGKECLEDDKPLLYINSRAQFAQLVRSIREDSLDQEMRSKMIDELYVLAQQIYPYRSKEKIIYMVHSNIGK